MFIAGHWWSLRYQGHRWGITLSLEGTTLDIAHHHHEGDFYFTPEGIGLVGSEGAHMWKVSSARALSWRFAFRKHPSGGIDLGNPPRSDFYLRVPLWIPILAIALPTAWLWRRDRRHPPGHCRKCGYDLTENVTGVCSECGTTKIEAE